ncbi:MAG: hypothetical protein CM15mP49_13630 [Actinomycetota bacterium]|nr:MAG: hypothetical protein CM15mP49_13630 [Actinomycetota bacterium]
MRSDPYNVYREALDRPKYLNFSGSIIKKHAESSSRNPRFLVIRFPSDIITRPLKGPIVRSSLSDDVALIVKAENIFVDSV